MRSFFYILNIIPSHQQKYENYGNVLYFVVLFNTFSSQVNNKTCQKKRDRPRNRGDWEFIVRDLGTIIVLLSFNLIPQRPHHSVTLQAADVVTQGLCNSSSNAWGWHNQSIQTIRSRCKLNSKKKTDHDDVTSRTTARKILKKISGLSTLIELALSILMPLP